MLTKLIYLFDAVLLLFIVLLFVNITIPNEIFLLLCLFFFVLGMCMNPLTKWELHSQAGWLAKQAEYEEEKILLTKEEKRDLRRGVVCIVLAVLFGAIYYFLK